MFNFIDIYSFIPMRCCVVRGSHALLCRETYNAVKTALGGAGTAYPSGAPEFTPGFSGVRVT